MSSAIEASRPTSLLVGVTGHRKLNAADTPALQAQVRAFFADLQARYPELPLVVLSPLAEGSDQLVAQVALDLGLRVIAPLPMPVEDYREDFVEPGPRACLEQQLQRSEVVVLPAVDAAPAPAAMASGSVRDLQYAHAGMFLSGHCHILLALWDGLDSPAIGGTAQLVGFHLHGDMPGHPVQPGLSVLGLEEATLVHHIHANRRGDAAAPRPSRWLTVVDDVVASAAMPATFDRMFRSQVAFNRDCATHAAALRVAGQHWEPGAATASAADRGDDDASACPVHRLFRATDWLASHYQRRVSRVLAATYLLAGATGSAFILYAHAHSQDAMIYLYLVLFVAGIALATVTRRRDWHRKYLDYRALAEGLRVASNWRRAGIVDLEHASAAHDNFMQEQDVELGWIRNVMRAASLEGILVPTGGGRDELDRVIAQWIGTDGSGGQLGYFAATAVRRTRMHHRAERLAMACLTTGITISVALALFARYLDPHTKTVLVVLMGLLSVAAAVHEAYAYKKADKELIKQYRFMQRLFAGARRRLDSCRDVEGKRRILRTLGEAALAEHAEWTLMHRERPLEHTRLGG